MSVGRTILNMFPMLQLSGRGNRSIYEETISKLNLNNREFHKNKLWKCFGCIHVQSATIILGLWHLSLHVTGLLMIMTLLMNPESFEDSNNDTLIGTQISMENDFETTDSPLLTANVKQFFCKENTSNNGELKLWVVLTCVSLIANLMIIYGTLCNKPTFMVPFFCLQLFDLLITASAVFTYTLFVKDTAEIFKPLSKFSVPLKLNTGQMKILTISVMVFAIVIKLYLLDVIWRCYKYLMVRQIIGLHGLHYVGDNTPGEEETNFKHFPTPPPSYNDIINQNANNTMDIPPPRYSSV